MLTIERLEEISEIDPVDIEGDGIIEGLLIVQKYFPVKHPLQAAEHDIIYTFDGQELIAAGLTEEDAIALNNHGWLISEYESTHGV